MSAAEKWKLCPALKLRLQRRARQRQALLAHGAADDGDGAGGAVVVVKAGVVIVHPADQPCADVRVCDQLLVGALAGVVADALDPELGPVGELADERLELARVEGAPAGTRQQTERVARDGAQPAHGRAHSAARPVGWPSARTVTSESSSQSSPPPRPSRDGSSTGRSDP